MTTARIVEGGSVTQFAVLDALLAGAYESGLPAAQLRSVGDFGLGCCDRLGGEVVLVDGELYECTPDGEVARMADAETLPFAMSCRFPATDAIPVASAELDALAALVDAGLASRNLFHAVRLDGVLERVRVRVTPRQHHPLPPLAEVTAAQIETELSQVRGTLIGFWTPAIYQGIAVAGLHLHFLAEDRRSGGHVLDVAVRSGELRLAAYAGFELRLPTDERFLRTELTHDDDHRIQAAEGGAAAR